MYSVVFFEIMIQIKRSFVKNYGVTFGLFTYSRRRTMTYLIMSLSFMQS